MGRTVCQAVADDAELELVAAADPGFGATALRSLVGDGVPDIVIDGELAGLGERGVDVVVDFTHHEAARANLAWAAGAGVHAVVGTSGFTEADHEGLRAQFTRSNCLIAPNFAIGAVLMMRFAELAAPWFETAEVIELHHDQKVDAPSGTAVGTVERMAAASTSTRCACRGWWPTRRCCWAPPGRRSPSATTATTGRASCPAWCWPASASAIVPA
jgi:4-hydroxy-tetrahydrodipicolinate reductase